MNTNLSVSIRKALPGDLSAITTLLHHLDLPVDGVKEHLAHFFVAEINNTIIGTIGLEIYRQTGLLRSAAVQPQYQHQGVGEALCDTIEHFAKENGVDELVLLTTTAEKYFARMGFTTVDRASITGDVLQSVEFKSACPSTAVCMRKTI